MACGRRRASTAALLAAKPTLQRRSESFTSTSRIPTPSRSETAQNRKRNHPPPSFLETSRLDGVRAPRTRGVPRYDGVRAADAQKDNDLAAALASGTGTTVDKAQAARLFKRAAERGHSRAVANLANLANPQ